MPKLDEYRRKRDFTKTEEPRPEPVEGPPLGGADAEARNLVFVIQQHAAYRAGMHWDFRLEADGVLKSWPLHKVPSLDPKQRRLANMVEDHPYDYRTFEGVIPKGEYGGGQVIVWDEGIYTPDEDGVTSWNDKDEGSRRILDGITKGKLSFTLQGHKLKGSFALVKTHYSPNSWLLIKHRDDFVSERDLTDEDVSVRSGLTVTDLKEGRLPPQPGAAPTVGPEAVRGAKPAPILDSRRERPMLATLVEKTFSRDGWIWEPKLDGIRSLVFISEGKVELRSRRGIDVTKAYPSIVKALQTLPVRSAVLDGEICALDEAGVPRFQLLQPRINLTKAADVANAEGATPVVFFVFDLLYLEGYDLRGVALSERKKLLERVVPSNGRIKLVTHVAREGLQLEELATRLGFEGVVGKRADSRYESGARSRAWVKKKAIEQQEFVVGGYTTGEGARTKSFGALSIGYYDDGKLTYAGNVGSGFNDAMLTAMNRRLKDLAMDETPFSDPKRVEGKPAWVRPEVVVQVKFAEWTNDGRLRAPVFLGTRDDVDPRTVRRERAESLATVEEAEEQGTGNREPGAEKDTEPQGASFATAGAQLSPPAASALPHESGTVASEVADVLAQLENPKANFVALVEGQRVNLTNLDKPFWPAHGDHPVRTKRDLVRFYTRVAPWLLPHLHDRPLTLTRYPNGVDGSLFYQKHYGQPIPDYVDTVSLWSESNDENGDYIMCNNLATLVWLAQIADLELHAWMSRLDPEPDAVGRPLEASGSRQQIEASVLNYPDYMIFDLDPYIYSGAEAKGAEPEFNRGGWEKTVEVALALKELLDQMRLSSYVKTSGKTGLHVYVPILRHYSYDELRAFTATLGRHLMALRPNDITMDWDTSKRRGKVFFDHNQNTRGKTLAAQYSLRPTPWAGVSTPIAWSELEGLDPVTLNLDSVPARLEAHGDLWSDSLARKNDLAALLGR